MTQARPPARAPHGPQPAAAAVQGGGASGDTALVAPSADQQSVSPALAGGTAPDEPVAGPLVSALRHPWLALLPMWLLFVPSVVAILAGTTTYGAASQVLVGRVDVESTAVPGFVAANQQLAGVYARLVGTEVIAAPVARELGLEPEDVLDRISATPVPESSIVLIETEATSQETAVTLASTVAERLVAYVQQTSVTPAGADAALEEFRSASATLVRAQQARDSARAAAAQASAATLEEAQATLVQAEAAVAAAQLQVDTLAGTFRSDLRGSGERNALQVISDALPTGSDRSSRLQLAAALSLVLGAAIGAALATLSENRGALRRLRARTGRTAQDGDGPAR